MDYSSLLSRPISYFGKEEVWIARGDDVSLFNSHRSNIQNYLKHSGIPESTQSPWIGLYRIGKSQEEARTVLVVSCSDRRIRKLTRNVLRNSPIFQQGGALARFKVISKATPPETASEPELTMQVDYEASVVPLKAENSFEENSGEDVQSHAQSDITLRLGKSQTGDSYLCRQIQASKLSQDGVLQSQTATAGPLLWLRGSSYQLTVEHIMNFSSRGADITPNNTDDDWDSDDEDDNDDGDGSNDCLFDEEIAPWDIGKAGIGSRAKSLTERSLSDSTSSNPVPELVATSSNPNLSPSLRADDSRSSSFINTNLARPGGIRDVITHDFLSPFNSNTTKPLTQCLASSEIDYLLIPVPIGSETELSFHGPTEMKEPSDAFSVHEQTEPRPVIIATASLGYVNGVMLPAPTLSRKPGSRSFQPFFCIKSHGGMPKGTSGSAVFDTQTGLLAGYIVLGCPGENTWYMAPITNVIDDIEASYGIVAQCLTRLNVSAIIKKNQEKSIIPSKSRFTKAPSQPYLQGLLKLVKPRGWRSQERAGIYRLSYNQRVIISNQWNDRFGSQAKIAGKRASDQPFLDIIRQQDPEISEVLAFMTYSSVCWYHRVSVIERFCEPAFPPFDDSIMGSIKNSGAGHSLQPKLWVSNPHSRSSYSPPKSVLDANKLYEILLQKCFSNGDSDTTAPRWRLIYISNPDAFCILALIRTAPQSQVNGFRELFNSYITEFPMPRISLKEHYWLGTNSFVISFNLPFFVIGTLDQNGNSTTSSKNRSIRRRYSLPFLNTDKYKSHVQQDKICLREAVYSIMVTGENDHYWTAVCLSDEYLNEELGEDQQKNKDTLEYEMDPILAKKGTEATDPMLSPRAYALTALSVALEKIADYHRELQDHFRASLDDYTSNIEPNSVDAATFPAIRRLRRDFRDVLNQAIYANLNISHQVSEFLGTDVMRSPESLPLNPMWIGTQMDLNVINSLRSIRSSRKVLLQLDTKLNELLSTHDKFVQESYNFHHETEVLCNLLMKIITLIAFVLGISTLVAQVYHG